MPPGRPLRVAEVHLLRAQRREEVRQQVGGRVLNDVLPPGYVLNPLREYRGSAVHPLPYETHHLAVVLLGRWAPILPLALGRPPPVELKGQRRELLGDPLAPPALRVPELDARAVPGEPSAPLCAS